MPESFWPLSPRHARLPKWAQAEISKLMVDAINADMANCLNAEVRRVAKQVVGTNCTFSDDDLRLLAHLAVRAIDAGLTDGLPAMILEGIEKAKAARAREEMPHDD